MNLNWIQLGSLLMFLGVLMGTIGTNALKQKVSKDTLYLYKTGIFYHLLHAVAVFFISYLASTYSDPRIQYAGLLFISGTLLYSGALYLYAITEFQFLRIIEHLGIICFLLGWFLLLHSNYQMIS